MKILMKNKFDLMYNIESRIKSTVGDENINLNDLDVSNITDVSRLFYQLKIKNKIIIDEWNTSNFNSMSGMFAKSDLNIESMFHNYYIYKK